MEKCMTNPKSEGYISAKDMAGRAAYYKVLQAAKNGELTRIKRGVYATDDHLASQMLDVEKVVPGGVLCLYSAWSHYQMTTQVPQEYCLAIKRGRKITLPDYPPITLYHWSDTAFNLGITNTEIEGWKSHATLTLLAKQDLPTFGYNMIAPLKSWCWGSILFYPFKISRFS